MERRYGRYVVVATLGSGAMGDVYRARDERLGREVAIKTVRDVAGLGADLFRTRFEAEARALAALSHPAIVAVHDLGIEGGEPYLVMELVDGPSLKAILAGGPMPAAEVRAMGIQLARALEAAHARQILHRDLKPANILRASNGAWKLADFGIARVPESDLTITGQFLGTPAYAAPESLALGEFSERSDVFGLAATMVEAASGARLRPPGTMSELVARDGRELVLPAGVPPELAAALRPALARDPERRPTAAAFAELLARAAAPATPGAPTPDATVPLRPAARAATPAPDRAATEPTAVVPAPTPPRRRRRAVAVAVAVGVGVAGVIAAAVATGRDRDAPPAGEVSPLPARDPAAAHEGAHAEVPARDPAAAHEAAHAGGPAPAAPPDAAPGRPLPPITPGRITVVYPPGLDRDAYDAYAEIVEKVREHELVEALELLDAYEETFGATRETHHLRAQLEAVLRPRRGPP